MISMVTNVCAVDLPRLTHTLPHYLRVLGDQIAELVVVVDPTVPSGRIAASHRQRGDPRAVEQALGRLASKHDILRVVQLPPAGSAKDVLNRWFASGAPERCHAGTPIFAFVYALFAARSRYVLRCDCDMLFYNNGWLSEGVRRLQAREAHLVGVPRLGHVAPELISTRAWICDLELLQECALPMPAYKIDIVRRIHRALHFRSPYLPLEQMCDRHGLRGRLRHVLLNEAFGFSVHAGKLSDFAMPNIGRVIHSIEVGRVPSGQARSWDLVPEVWQAV